MILLEVAVNLFTRTWFRIRSVTSARQACRKIAVLSLIRSQRQLACEGLYYDAGLIHRILKSLPPQNNTFFIATASVVKDAADNPDCHSQGLREQWYYLRFYVRRTMPPTVSPVNSPRTKASDMELWCFPWSATEQTFKQTIKTPVIWDAIALIMTSL